MIRTIVKILFITGILLYSSLLTSQSDPKTSLKLGQIEYEKGNFKKAEKIFVTGRSGATYIYETEDALLLYWLGKTYYKIDRNNYKKALIYFNNSTIRNPSFAASFYLKARIQHFEEGMSNAVIANYENTISNAKNSDIDITAISLYSIGRKDEAKQLLETSSLKRKQNKINQVNYALAVIHLKEGNINLSLEKLKSSIDNGYTGIGFLMIDFFELKNNLEFQMLLNDYDLLNTFFQSKYEKVFKEIVEGKVNKWQQKGKFEKTAEYQVRVNEDNRKKKIEYYTSQVIDSIGTSFINWELLNNEYDADNETFKLSLGGIEPIFIYVPINEAPSFDAGFQSLEYSNINFSYLGYDEFELVHMEITNPNNGKTYIYSRQEAIAYNSTKLDFNFDDIEIDLNPVEKSINSQTAKENTQVISVGKSDVDTNIPKTNLNNGNTYALIIGNEDYTKYQTSLSSESNVDFAIRDAEIFAEYAEKTLGIPGENITILKDAISSQMQREIEKISKIAKYHNGEANIIFYYAGHGLPDETTKESYLMPVDVSGTDVTYGIKLNYLYQKLTQYPTQKVLVILDACFSGGGRNQGLLAARGVKIKPKENVINGNLVVFSSSTGEQSSLPYQNKQHGMFTYFLLKKLKESKGDITLEELSDYVTKEVQINALKINSKEQNPNILVSPDVGNLWMDWKLN